MIGTFGIDFNLAVWRIRLQSPNFMSTNTDYSQTIPFMSVFINPIHQTKSPPICITFQFAKLNVRQMYCVYVSYHVHEANNIIFSEKL